MNINRKKAEMSLFGALLAFAILILMFSFFEFYNTSNKINNIENAISSSLSDVCLQNTIKDYDYIKYQNKWNTPKSINEKKYKDAVFKNLGYSSNGINWSKDDYEIKDVKLMFDSNGYGFKLKYKLKIPVRVLGIQVTDIELDKVASAALLKKY